VSESVTLPSVILLEPVEPVVSAAHPDLAAGIKLHS
jgi:hypothetical protein